MFELTYRNKKVTELTDIQSQKVHTGGTKFAKKNKHTCTTIRDTRVLYLLTIPKVNFIIGIKLFSGLGGLQLLITACGVIFIISACGSIGFGKSKNMLAACMYVTNVFLNFLCRTMT